MLRKLGIYAILSVGLVLVAAMLVGCSEDTEKPPEEFAPPGTLTIAGVGESAIAVRWGASSDEPLSNFHSYAVYWNPGESIRNVLPADFPVTAMGDTVPKGEGRTYTIENLDQGTQYYVHVRALKSNGDFSVGSNEVSAAPRPQGDGVIYEFASNSPSAFDFSGGVTGPMQSTRKDSCDVYLGTAQSNDQSGALFLKSPDKVSVNPQNWTTRVTQIKDVGLANNDVEYDAITTTNDSGWSSSRTIAVELNHVYIFKTPENHYAKMWITGTTGVPPNRTVMFMYAYQPIVNYASFSPRKP